MPIAKTRPRRDKGLILATPRDIETLTYMAHHSVVRYDHIKELLGRAPGGPTKNADGLADTTVKDQINRWRRAGWISYTRVLASERGYAWVAKNGLSLIGLDDIYSGHSPAPLRYHHYWAVSDVCLFWWQGEKDDPGVWIPERRLRAEQTSAKKIDPDHIFAPIRILPGPVPDAVVSGDGWCDAIEVQLSPLKPLEMEKKLEKLCRARYRDTLTDKEYIYNAIHFYVPSEALEKHINKACAKLSASDRERIDITVDTSYMALQPHDENSPESRKKKPV